MKIAFVTQEYPPETAHGGIGTQAFAKAHGLAGQGHDVWVVSHSRDQTRHEYLQDRVHVVRIPGFDQQLVLATEEVRWLTYSALVAAEVEQLRTRVPLELVEFADWGCEAYVHLLNRTDWNYLSTVIHLHGPIVMFAHALGWPEPASRFFQVAREMERTTLELADGVLSSSKCSARWCAEQYGLNAEEIPTLHTGVETELFRPLPVPKATRPTVIFVGKIERTKGIDVLVEAACRLAREIPDLQVRLLGRGSQELTATLDQMAATAGFPQLLDWAGFVRREELPEHLSRAHIFVGTSVYEGGPGFVYLEAMACGLPVIASAGSGAAEVVIPGETGLLVPPRDVESLVAGMRHLLTQHAERTALGHQAAQFVAREADSRVCLQRLENYYLQFATGERAARRVAPFDGTPGP